MLNNGSRWSAGTMVVLMAAMPAMGDEWILLKDPDEKISVRIESVNSMAGGQVSTEGAGGAKATVGVTRKRLFERRYLGTALGGELRYRILRDEITSTVDGQSTVEEAPLNGKMVSGQRNSAGNWVFSLENGTALGPQVEELELLGAFENKRWLPGFHFVRPRGFGFASTISTSSPTFHASGFFAFTSPARLSSRVTSMRYMSPYCDSHVPLC